MNSVEVMIKYVSINYTPNTHLLSIFVLQLLKSIFGLLVDKKRKEERKLKFTLNVHEPIYILPTSCNLFE